MIFTAFNMVSQWKQAFKGSHVIQINFHTKQAMTEQIHLSKWMRVIEMSHSVCGNGGLNASAVPSDTPAKSILHFQFDWKQQICLSGESERERWQSRKTNCKCVNKTQIGAENKRRKGGNWSCFSTWECMWLGVCHCKSQWIECTICPCVTVHCAMQQISSTMIFTYGKYGQTKCDSITCWITWLIVCVGGFVCVGVTECVDSERENRFLSTNF